MKVSQEHFTTMLENLAEITNALTAIRLNNKDEEVQDEIDGANCQPIQEPARQAPPSFATNTPPGEFTLREEEDHYAGYLGVGEIAVLASGGPPMTVTGVAKNVRICAYFDGSKLNVVAFRPVCLDEASEGFDNDE